MLDGCLSDLFYCDERTEEFIEAMCEALRNLGKQPEKQDETLHEPYIQPEKQDERREESPDELMPF